MKEDFINKAKDVLKNANADFDCYHEAQLTGGDNQELFAELYYLKDDRYMTFTYTPEIAPCKDVLQLGSLCITDNVISQYPKDRGLIYVKAEAYVGLKTQNGLRALLSPKACSSPEKILNLLKKL